MAAGVGRSPLVVVVFVGRGGETKRFFVGPLDSPEDWQTTSRRYGADEGILATYRPFRKLSTSAAYLSHDIKTLGLLRVYRKKSGSLERVHMWAAFSPAGQGCEPGIGGPQTSE